MRSWSQAAPSPSIIPASSRLRAFARNWGVVALRGVLAIVFGLFAIFWPGIALQSLILLFAIYALMDGVAAFISCTRAASHHERWFVLAFESVATIIAGVVALLLPGVTLLVFVFLLAIWALVTGTIMVAAAWQLHRAHGRLLLAFSGVLSLCWGGLLVAMPAVGAVVLAFWLGIYALLFGVSMLALSATLRRIASLPPSSSSVAW